VLFTILFVVVTVKTMLAQSIELSTLLEFQEKQDPSFIANYLSSTGAWISDHTVFQDTKAEYKWFKAAAEETFEPHTRDKLSYIYRSGYRSAIAYVTLTKGNFDQIIAQIQSTMALDATLIDDERVKLYKYSNADFVVEVIEPFQPQKDNIFRYAFLVYDKDDYVNGFKIR
jgi:hypothetical protein